MSAIQIRDWRPLRKGSLVGFAKVEMPSGMILNDVTIMSGDRGAWASPPSKPQVGKDGTALTDSNGKIRYTPIVEFTSKEVRHKFSDAVIDALRVAHPEVFT